MAAKKSGEQFVRVNVKEIERINAIMGLSQGEFEEIHNLLDTVEVPRQIDEEPQSAAQRVAYFVAATRTYGNLHKKIFAPDTTSGGNGPH